MTYAQGTSVPVRKSRMEIEEMLERARARAVYTGSDEGRAVVGFVLDNRHIRFEIKLPLVADYAAHLVRGYRTKRTDEHMLKAWEQACREKWRALVLALKSKFVSIEAGVENVEEAFLAHVVLANKGTVHQWFRAQLEKADLDGVRLLGEGATP